MFILCFWVGLGSVFLNLAISRPEGSRFTDLGHDDEQKKLLVQNKI